MTNRRRTILLVALLLTLPERTDAEPLHIKTPSSVTTDGGSSLRLPPGYFLEEPVWSALDTEMKRLQEREIRLNAENRSLRDSAKEISFGWYALGAVIVAGFTAGYLYGK